MDKMVWDSLGYFSSPILLTGVCCDYENNKLYLVGGNTSTTYPFYYNFYTPAYTLAQIQEFDLVTKKWRTISMNYSIMGSAVGYWNGNIYTIGGFYGNRGELSSSTYYYQIYRRQVIYKYPITGNTSTAAVDVTYLPTPVSTPTYVQIGRYLYIFGGGEAPNISTNNGGNVQIRATEQEQLNKDVRFSYIFDMESETLTNVTPIPIRGGLNLKSCYDGFRYIYIRNDLEFCRFDTITLDQELLPSFTYDSNIFNPELYYIELDGKEYVVSCGGTTDNQRYAEMYDIENNQIIPYPENCQMSIPNYYTSNISTDKVKISIGGSSYQRIWNGLQEYRKEVI